MLRNKESSREWQDRVEMTSPLVNAILARANTLNVPGVGAYSKDCVTVLKDIWCVYINMPMCSCTRFCEAARTLGHIDLLI